jgi:hypothetical protein
MKLVLGKCQGNSDENKDSFWGVLGQFEQKLRVGTILMSYL